MLTLFTDFGASDLYAGQVRAVLHRMAPGVPVVDLLHDAPSFAVRPAAHLLAAMARELVAGDVCIAVVDPGVGSERLPVVLQADGRWFVGPDNGLLSVVAARAGRMHAWRIVWRPERLSDTFHGRDLFAPMAAELAACPFPEAKLAPLDALRVSFGAPDLPEVIYIDHYGNALTGLHAERVDVGGLLTVGGRSLPYARVFAEAALGEPFWYRNSLGLVEIALAGGSAARALGLAVGQRVALA